MGCCYSLPSTVDPIQDETTDASSEPRNGRREDPPLTKFSFYDLKMATRYFSPENIVTEHGFDIVFKGRLQNGSVIAVKVFNSTVWPDLNLFVEEAQRVGRLRHKRIVNLIGYCCDGDKRLLVADFMPNDTLAKRLFQRKHQTMDWPTRLRVAYGVAEALCYCNTAGFASYNNLSAYKVLFDEDGNACLSCFGLVKEINDDQRTTTGSVNPHNMTYRFGTILVNLISGKQIPPSHAPSREVIETTTQQEEASSSTRISPLGEACSRMDLASIHKIMVSTAYDDDKDFIELSFEEWIQEVKELQDVRKQGDQAFVEQDFKTAIDCYSQFIDARSMVYPSVYARRSLCYLFCNEPDKALLDGMTAQTVYPDWPTAFYLQSVALAKLNMNIDSTNTLKEAAILEAKRKHQ
ncbi:PREDICTED: probable inactive receptor-like kinase SSP [Camelina sativa]|uniref:Serine/threonine-protein kinase BSK n=1 Tax=Camelina sativa TaxID=90675 RepID=A0ABM0XSH0_CAMSA|nr:PREDICTED: probable inactive receptor-like kinase SSP [Camelina sativa]